MDKLKPCPFCGGEAKKILFLGFYTVGCGKCPAVICPSDDPQRPYSCAEAEWNRRVELTDLELDEKLQKKYDEGFMDGQDYAVSVM